LFIIHIITSLCFSLSLSAFSILLPNACFCVLQQTPSQLGWRLVAQPRIQQQQQQQRRRRRRRREYYVIDAEIAKARSISSRDPAAVVGFFFLLATAVAAAAADDKDDDDDDDDDALFFLLAQAGFEPTPSDSAWIRRIHSGLTPISLWPVA
jgi:hypothetical protein